MDASENGARAEFAAAGSLATRLRGLLGYEEPAPAQVCPNVEKDRGLTNGSLIEGGQEGRRAENRRAEARATL
jgi:hypothetical protein